MKKVTVGKSKGLADAEQCDIHVVGNSFKITDADQEKLDFILGHSIARDFPKTQPTKEWAGAVLDFLEITGFLK